MSSGSGLDTQDLLTLVPVPALFGLFQDWQQTDLLFNRHQGRDLQAFENLRQTERLIPPYELGPEQEDVREGIAALYEELARGFADSGDVDRAVDSVRRMIHLHPAIQIKPELADIATSVRG